MTINERLAQVEGVRLTDSHQHYQTPAPGLPLLVIDRPECRAVIALQGAQILEFVPRHGAPLLWLSPRARFIAGEPIRGGIPVCAPWFGRHPTDSSKPSHGFARNRPWQLTDVASLDDGELILHFCLHADEQSRRLFPFDFSMQLELQLGNALNLSFTVINHSNESMPVSWALHSYFPVEELSTVRIDGLTGLASVDNARGQRLPPLAGPLAFEGEVDRFFTGAPTRQSLSGPSPLSIEGDNCPTVITWNPGRDKAAQMPDIGAEHYTGFVCVERGAAFEDAWCIAPGASRRANLRISR